MARIAADENLHSVFYRDILSAAIAIRPSEAVIAIVAGGLAFDMPGTSIPGYLRKATQLARAGIFDLRIFHDEVLLPILRHWRVFELEGLTPEAEAARQQLATLPPGAGRQRSPLRGAARRQPEARTGSCPRGCRRRPGLTHRPTRRECTIPIRRNDRATRTGRWPATSSSWIRSRGSRCSPTWSALRWSASSTPRRKPGLPGRHARHPRGHPRIGPAHHPRG